MAFRILNEIDFYPALAKIARERHDYKGIQRFWYALRVNVPDSGIITPSDARERFSIRCAVKCRMAYYVLNAGDGLYWDYTKGRRQNDLGSVRVYTLHEVCHALGVSHAGDAVKRPLEDLYDPDFVAKTWVLCGENIGTAPTLTRAIYHKLTGFSPRSQQRFNKALGIKPIRNLEALTASHDKNNIVACANKFDVPNRPGYYQSYLFLDGMCKAVPAIFRPIGTSFPGNRKSQSKESTLVYIGTRRGTAIYTNRANLTAIQSACNTRREFKANRGTMASTVPPVRDGAFVNVPL